MKNNKKLVALICVVLLMVGAAGATLAWLTAQTQTITNTFTSSDINITLTETDATKVEGSDNQTKSYEMVPGATLDKDPTITVKGGSEACYLFVKVEKSTNFGTYLTARIVEAWKSVPGTTDVYYQVVAAADTDQTFGVLVNDEVTVNTTVTKADMEALNAEGAEQPTIAFKAYAVQQANIGSAENTEAQNAAIAWAEASE